MKHVLERFSPVDIDDDASTEKVEAYVSHARECIAELHAKGYETQIVRLPEFKSFDEILFIKRKEEEKMHEPTVRVYRGIGVHNTSIRQEPYAIRAEAVRGDLRIPQIIEAGRATLEQLLAELTYAHLIAHMTVMRSYLSDREWEGHVNDLHDIEEAILNGETLRRLLISQQHAHNGVVSANSGLAPYVSTTYDPREAVRYSRGAIMILDIPVSQIEEYHADNNDEVQVKGPIVEKYITAIAFRHNPYSGEQVQREFAQDIVPRIETVAQRNGYSNEDVRRAREVKIATEHALDEQFRTYDVIAIQERRKRDQNFKKAPQKRKISSRSLDEI